MSVIQKIYAVGDIIQPVSSEYAQKYPAWLKVSSFNPKTHLYQLCKPFAREIVLELSGSEIQRRSVHLKMRYEDLENKHVVIVDPGDMELSNMVLCVALAHLEKEGYLVSSIDNYGSQIYRMKGAFETTQLTRPSETDA